MGPLTAIGRLVSHDERSALAEAELNLTQTTLTYAKHLQAGRMPSHLVSEDNIALPQRAPAANLFPQAPYSHRQSAAAQPASLPA